MTKHERIAQIATNMPARPPTSADILEALGKAWDAGREDGFTDGFATANRQNLIMQEIVMKAF